MTCGTVWVWGQCKLGIGCLIFKNLKVKGSITLMLLKILNAIILVKTSKCCFIFEVFWFCVLHESCLLPVRMIKGWTNEICIKQQFCSQLLDKLTLISKNIGYPHSFVFWFFFLWKQNIVYHRHGKLYIFM